MELEKIADEAWEALIIKVDRSYIKNGKVEVLLYGDIHYGSSFCDEKYAKKVLDDAKKNNRLILCMGDLLEVATRDSVGSGVYKQKDVVQGQLETMVKWLKPYRENIIGLLDGNHEDRIFKNTGLNLMKTMATILEVPYLGCGRLIQLAIGNQKYSIYATHGDSNATNAHSKIRAVLRLQEYIDADVYCMGHLHSLDSHATSSRKLKDNGEVTLEDKLFVLTGHYLNYIDSYAHKKCLVPGKKGSPVVSFYSNKKKTEVSL